MNEIIKIDVHIENDKAVTDSKNVANVFGKRHDHVIRDIENIKNDLPNFGEMFREVQMPDSYGRFHKAYQMNRDGLSILAMGFNGKEAMEWKVKYIEAFNKMEAELNSPEQIMARALKIADKTIASLRNEIAEQRPLVEFANHVAQSSDTVDMSEIAKLAADENIHVGRNRLFDWMRKKKYLMQNNLPYQEYVDRGYMKIVDVPKETPYGSRVFQKTVFTGKGQIWIIEKLRKEYIHDGEDK